MKSLGERIAVDVPFSRVVRAVAGRREQSGEKPGPGGPRCLHATIASRQRVAANGLRVVARQ